MRDAEKEEKKQRTAVNNSILGQESVSLYAVRPPETTHVMFSYNPEQIFKLRIMVLCLALAPSSDNIY